MSGKPAQNNRALCTLRAVYTVTRHFNCLTDCSITANSILKFIDISYYSVLVFTARFFLPLLTQLEMSIMLS